MRYTGDDVRYDTRPGSYADFGSPVLQYGERLDSELYPLVLGEDSVALRQELLQSIN